MDGAYLDRAYIDGAYSCPLLRFPQELDFFWCSISCGDCYRDYYCGGYFGAYYRVYMDRVYLDRAYIDRVYSCLLLEFF